MHYHQDWFMRQIQMLISFLLRLLTGEPQGKQEAALLTLSDQDLLARLEGLVGKNRLCEAENLLYEAADGSSISVFYAGLWFYDRLSSFPEPQLERCNFSREEIQEGIFELCRRYGISADALSLHLGGQESP